MNNLGKKLADGVILFASCFMAVKGYHKAVEMYEEAVPSAIDKVHMVGLVASMNKKQQQFEED